MISLLRRGAFLVGVMVLIVAGVGQAQIAAVVVPDSSLHDVTIMSLEHRLADLEKRLAENFDRSDTPEIHYGMPIYNPDTEAAMKVFRPSDDLIYNMPIFGKQSESSNVLNCFIIPDTLILKKE